MRVLLQRVSSASVRVEGATTGAIEGGLLLLVGVGPGDGREEAQRLADKVATLRIFSDDAGKFNRSLLDVGGAALVVSQFTLYADTRKGRRPSFIDAAPPEQAAPLVDIFAAALQAHGIRVERGVFGAHMRVTLVNDGPVTIMLESAERKA